MSFAFRLLALFALYSVLEVFYSPEKQRQWEGRVPVLARFPRTFQWAMACSILALFVCDWVIG